MVEISFPNRRVQRPAKPPERRQRRTGTVGIDAKKENSCPFAPQGTRPMLASVKRFGAGNSEVVIAGNNAGIVREIQRYKPMKKEDNVRGIEV